MKTFLFCRFGQADYCQIIEILNPLLLVLYDGQKKKKIQYPKLTLYSAKN